jgi:hypothetical protein
VTEAALLLREIAASGAAPAFHFYVFPATPIVRHGSDAMKDEYLPSIARGEIVMAFGITEPSAGTDTSRITTKAEKKGDKWIINGKKVWTTNAQNASHILLLTRTSPRIDEWPLDGMTLLFAPLDREYCTIRAIKKLGRSAVDSNEVFINDFEADDSHAIGEVGQGFKYLLDGLNPGRVVIAMESVGMGQAALRLAVNYAGQRVMFERPIGAYQAVAHPLAEAWARLEAASSWP